MFTPYQYISYVYKFDEVFFLWEDSDYWGDEGNPEFIDEVDELLTDKSEFIPINYGQEYTGGENLEAHFSPDYEADPVLTGVYTIRIGDYDRVFSWLKQIGNQNLFITDKYSQMSEDERLQEYYKDFADIEDLVLKHKKRPRPTEMLTFHIKQFSSFKKELLKKPYLSISHYELEFFYHPYKKKHYFENTPFDSFISLSERENDEKEVFKEKFLNENREVVELFISDKKIKYNDETQEEIKKIICLIYGIYDKYPDVDKLLNLEFNNKKYIFNKEHKLPNEIVNIITRKMKYEIPEEDYGITYHPILSDQGHISGQIKTFNANYLEEDYLDL